MPNKVINSKDDIALCFPAQSRINRLNNQSFNNIPKDFFYGYFYLKSKNYKVEILDTRIKEKKFKNTFGILFENIRNRIINFGFSYLNLIILKNKLKNKKIIFSFHDSFSISLGMYRTKIIKNKNTKLVAGFMGLMDLEKKTNFIFRKLIHEIITYSLKNLDYIFFFSPVDREESCKKYKININKTFLFPFGIDYEFWKNEKFNQRKSFILSVGSDSNRDYNTINKLSINENILILSNLKLSYINNKNIKIINGNYAKNNVSDLELKKLYSNARFLVVTTHNVYQPSGQSVILQAMASGCVVIFTKNKSEWYENLLVNNHNCYIVDCYDYKKISKIINNYKNDISKYNKISINAQLTIKNNFNLNKANLFMEKLIRKIY